MFASILSAVLLAQSAVLIKAHRLIDPRSGNVISPAAVRIEGDKIKEVGPGASAAGATIVDLGSATLMPGMIDSHTHLLLDVIIPAQAEMPRYTAFQPGLLLAVACSVQPNCNRRSNNSRTASSKSSRSFKPWKSWAKPSFQPPIQKADP